MKQEIDATRRCVRKGIGIQCCIFGNYVEVEEGDFLSTQKSTLKCTNTEDLSKKKIPRTNLDELFG